MSIGYGHLLVFLTGGLLLVVFLQALTSSRLLPWRAAALVISLVLLSLGGCGVIGELYLPRGWGWCHWRFDLLSALFIFLMALGFSVSVSSTTRRRPALSFLLFVLALCASSAAWFLGLVLAASVILAYPRRQARAGGVVLLVLPALYSCAAGEGAAFALGGGWYVIGSVLLPFLFCSGRAGREDEAGWLYRAWPSLLSGSYFAFRFYWPFLAPAERERFVALGSIAALLALGYWLIRVSRNTSARLTAALFAHGAAALVVCVSGGENGPVLGAAHLLSVSLFFPLVHLGALKRSWRWARPLHLLAPLGLAGLPPSPAFSTGLVISLSVLERGGWGLVALPLLALAFAAAVLEMLAGPARWRSLRLSLPVMVVVAIILVKYVVFPGIGENWGYLLIMTLEP